MKKTLMTVAFAASMMILAACGDKPVPQDIVDGNMSISRTNAQKNADSFRLAVYPDSGRALVDSDSGISPACRYGDGWASGRIEFFEGPNAGKRLKIKCQTNGSGKGIGGCLTEADFLTKDYKGQEGTCQNLTALEKFK